MNHKISVIAIVLFSLTGCTRVVVNKDPGPHDKGFRYNRPKPYLFIGPAPQAQKSSDAASTDVKPPGKEATDPGGSGTSVTVTDNNFVKVTMEIKYLPDYNEEYSIKLRPGIGVGTLNFKLEDGWNLTSVGMQTDQKIPELITSVASLVGAVRGSPAGGAAKKSSSEVAGLNDVGDIVVDTRPDVPLGFYEPIIATDQHGRKSLFGWRYVGFMPFSGCPVDVCAPRQTVECGMEDMWGIVATPNSIKFQKLSEIRDGVGTPWGNPYQRMGKNGALLGPAPPPAVKETTVISANPSAPATNIPAQPVENGDSTPSDYPSEGPRPPYVPTLPAPMSAK